MISSDVAQTSSSSSSIVARGLLGGGVRKSGMYPSGGVRAIAPPRSSSAAIGSASRIHGRCSAVRAGSRRARRELTSSNIGEIAKRVWARSSMESLSVTI